MDKRLGFVGIIVEDRKASGEKVNRILAEYGDAIVVRTGVPNARGHCSIISVVIEATTDEMGALTGKLGKLTGVSVKSALSKI